MQAAFRSCRRCQAKRTHTQQHVRRGRTNDYQKYYALQCLRARRLVEAGVRFVEITCPADARQQLPLGPARQAQEAPRGKRPDHRPAGGRAIIDLKRRGLLDETIVLWAGEMGRTPHTPAITNSAVTTM